MPYNANVFDYSLRKNDWRLIEATVTNFCIFLTMLMQKSCITCILDGYPNTD